MKIKRFVAPDMRQAMRMVREEQGSDAVILSSRRAASGTEILVAVDYDESVVANLAESAESRTAPAQPGADPARDTERRGPAGLRADPTPPRGGEGDAALGAMGHELKKLRAALEHQLHWLGHKDINPVKEDLLSRLDRLGIGQTLAESIATEVGRQDHSPERAWGVACRTLSARMAVVADDVINSGGVMALIGPTGVGKTTTVAKLAARFALRYGRRHVALITTDTYRIGAQEQLLTFGEILGIPVESASSRSELSQALQRHAHKKLVLVDNAGLSQRDLRLAAQLADLDCIPFIKSYLVISCTTQPSGLDEIFAAFGRTRLQGCILTKLDEAVSLGPVIDALVRQQLLLVYACDGQRVPEDIHPGFSADLVGRAEELAADPEPGFARKENYTEGRVANGLV
ncbi:MAG: flagellar biosynthesis protein FlhF [Chromatiaceae bacterium]|jgi:flagellar biosynthesis protein FlhF